MKKLLFILLFFMGINTNGQKGNVFHNREFWKKNPSINIIDKKISEGNNISALNKNAHDAVTYALLEKVDNKTVKYLLSKKGNGVNKKTHDGRTYIFWAAYKNNLEILKYLVSKGAETDIIDSHGYSVSTFSATTGQIDTNLYDYLFKMNANIETEKNHNGANVLLLVAPYVKNYSLIRYFLNKGASLDYKDNEGNGVFEYAAKGGNITFLKSLLENGVEKGDNSMIFASEGLRRKKNTLETYKFLESIGAKPNTIDKKGRNPLHSIAYNGKDLEIYKYFINKGVDINKKDNEGSSPFMNAANSNNIKVMSFLINYIRDINKRDLSGRSALALAVYKNDAEVVEFLVKNGANVKTKDNNDNTISFYLINSYSENNEKRFNAKLSILKKNGLILNEVQSGGNTLLHFAVEKNNLKLIKKLAPFNIDINSKNNENLSALQVACMRGNNDKIIKYLLLNGANKNVITDFGETVYDLAHENELFKKQNINITFLK